MRKQSSYYLNARSCSCKYTGKTCMFLNSFFLFFSLCRCYLITALPGPARCLVLVHIIYEIFGFSNFLDFEFSNKVIFLISSTAIFTSKGARIKSLVLHGNAHPTNGEFWKKMWNAEIMWNSHVDFKYFLQIWNDQKKRLAITKLFREHSETAINEVLDGSEKVTNVISWWAT